MSNDSTAGCPKCAGLAACWCPPLSPKYSTDPRLNAALEADARKLEAMGGDPGITLDDVASLSPIALDFEAAEDEARKKRHQYENAEVGIGCRDPLDAQLRAIVARVAQEEREKMLDKMAQMAEGYRDALKIEGVSEYTESRVRQNRDALLLVIDLLRGTP